MKNKLLLEKGIELLQGINTEDLEVVEVENTKYDDGSVMFSVSVAFPSEEK